MQPRARPPRPPPTAHPTVVSPPGDAFRQRGRHDCCPITTQGAQRASCQEVRSLLIAVFAALVLITGTTASAPEAQAATRKVVIVVGPVGSATAYYKDSARKLADLARSYGARVKEIYSPYATWSRVRDAAVGANLLIYLGHGNGWPSPYYPYSTTSKDGIGLNASSGNGNSNMKYYGEDYMAVDLAPQRGRGALNRLCYASGNNEWGAGNPTRRPRTSASTTTATASSRRAPRRCSPAASPTSAMCSGACSRARGRCRCRACSGPTRTGPFDYQFSFNSSKIDGVSARMDPYAPSRYYRSVIGRLGTTVGDWRAGS